MFEGKVAVVTGASRGIGMAIANKLAENDAKVAVNYASNDMEASKVVESIVANGGVAKAFKADVGDYAQAEQLARSVIEEFGRVDILVNNAGISIDKLLYSMTEEEFDRVIKTNLKGVFNCIKHVSKTMMKQNFGRIISISSIIGFTGNLGQVNYAASKAGIIGITKSFAKEVAKSGITVNAIAPGYISTDLTEKIAESKLNQIISSIPAGRLGIPEDIANAVVFLASENASYITGETITISGGLL